ncbi:hypothetical protein L6V77_11010 [Myxococcota bacterium]|nr:hypothetical protein [Myxococcota bacterium]
MSHRVVPPPRHTGLLLTTVACLAACEGTGGAGGADPDAGETRPRRDAQVERPAVDGGAPGDARTPGVDGGVPGDARAPVVDAAVDGGATPADARPPLADAAEPPLTDAAEPPPIDAAEPPLPADAAPPVPDGPPPGSLDTFIDLPPPALTNERELPVRLRSSSPRATFECRLDDADFAPCAARPGLVVETDGPHVFQARAVFGADVDETPAEVAFTLDTVAPDLAVEGGQTDAHLRAAAFALTWDAADATVTCTLDGQGLAECPPDLSLVGLAEGPHALEVTATDGAGNATTRRIEWEVSVSTVSLPAPEERRFLNFDQGSLRAPRMVVGPDGTAHHIYGTARLWYRASTPGAAVEVVDDVPVGFVMSVAVGPAGVPHVVYFDRRAYRLKHAWRTANGWQVEDTGLIEDLAALRFIHDGLALALGPDEGLHLLWAQESGGDRIHHATRPPVGPDDAPAVRGPEAWTDGRFLPDSSNDEEIGVLATPDGRVFAAWCHGDGSSPWQTAVWSTDDGWQPLPMPQETPGCRDRGPPTKLSLRADGTVDAVLGATAFFRPAGADAWFMASLPGLSMPAGALARDEPGAWRVDAFYTGRGVSIVAGDLVTFSVGPDGAQSERRLRLGADNSPSLAVFDRAPGQATHGHVAWPTRIEDVDPTATPLTRTLVDEGFAYGPLDGGLFWGDRLSMADTRLGAAAPEDAVALTLYLKRYGTDGAGRTTEQPVAVTLRDGVSIETPLPPASGLSVIDTRGRFYRVVGRGARQIARFDPETGIDVDYPAVPDALGGSLEAMHALDDGTVYLGYSGPDRIVRLTEAAGAEILPMPPTFDAAVNRNQCQLRMTGGDGDRPLVAVYGCDWPQADVVVWRAGVASHEAVPGVHGPVAPFASPTRVGFVELDIDGPPVLRVFEVGGRGVMASELPVEPPPSGFAFDAQMGADDRLRVLVDGVVRTEDPLDDPFGERLDAVQISHFIETTEGWRVEPVGTGGGEIGLHLDAAGDATMIWWDRRELAWRMARR